MDRIGRDRSGLEWKGKVLMANKTISQISVDAQVIATRLGNTAAGETIPYHELTALVGRDVTKEARGILYTARRVVLRQKGLVFDAVFGVGIKRLSQEEIPALGEQAIVHIRRTARRARYRISRGIANYDELPGEKRTQAMVANSMLGALESMANPRQQEKIKALVERSGQSIPMQKVLESFQQDEWERKGTDGVGADGNGEDKKGKASICRRMLP